MLSGLWASQSDEYPVTVRTGHSISELILSPQEILYTGIAEPDAVVLISEDGYKQAAHYLDRLTPRSWLFVPPAFAGLSTTARKVVLDPAAAGLQNGKRHEGLLLSAAALRLMDIFPMEACAESDPPRAGRPVRRGESGVLAASARMTGSRAG